MKRFTYLCLFLSVFFVTSCGSNHKTTPRIEPVVENLQLDSTEAISFVTPGAGPMAPQGMCSGGSYTVNLIVNTYTIQDCSGPNQSHHEETLQITASQLEQVRAHLSSLQLQAWPSESRPCPADFAGPHLRIRPRAGGSIYYSSLSDACGEDPRSRNPESTNRGVVRNYGEVRDQIRSVFHSSP